MRKMRNRDTHLKLKIPADFNPDMRADLAQRVIEFIQDRSKKGLNVSGRDWSGKAGQYTEAYAKRKGVSEDGPVDLSLSHEMLDAISYLPSLSPSGQITVGFRKGSLVERKAEGNILGTYGQPSPIPGKARPFLDILRRDLQKLIDEVRNDSET
jgi:phage gpG-like protein